MKGYKTRRVFPEGWRIKLQTGEDDSNAPFDLHGRYLAEKIPAAVPHFYPGEGHLPFIHKQYQNILRTTVG